MIAAAAGGDGWHGAGRRRAWSGSSALLGARRSAREMGVLLCGGCSAARSRSALRRLCIRGDGVARVGRESDMIAAAVCGDGWRGAGRRRARSGSRRSLRDAHHDTTVGCVRASTGVSGVCSLPGLGATASGLGEGRTPGAHAGGAHTFQIISISRFIQTRGASLYEPRLVPLTKEEPLFRGVPSWTSEFPAQRSWVHRSRRGKRSFPVTRKRVTCDTCVLFVTFLPPSARWGAPCAHPAGGALPHHLGF